MFCNRCGAKVDEGQRFCTECGAPVAESTKQVLSAEQTTPINQASQNSFVNQTTSMNQPVVETATQEPQKSKGSKGNKISKGGRIALIVGGVVIILAIVALVVIFLLRPTSTDVYYGSDTTVELSKNTTVIAYDASNNPLQSYVVTLTPENVSADISWDNATITVEGTGGFNFADISELPDGTYNMTIVDSSNNTEAYNCPTVQITSNQENTQSVNLRPDPSNAESAKAPISYDFSYTTTDVQIVHTDQFGTGEYNETWQYPQFTSSVESEGLNTVNTQLKNAFDTTLESTKNWTESSGMQCLDYDQTVTYLSGSTASVRTATYVTGWGAHGSDSTSGAIYNLETGEAISPASAMGLSDSDLKQQAADGIRAYLKTDPSDIYDELDIEASIEDIVADYSRYYLTDDGLVVATQPYELGSFAYGSRDILVIAFSDQSLVGNNVRDQIED